MLSIEIIISSCICYCIYCCHMWQLVDISVVTAPLSSGRRRRAWSPSNSRNHHQPFILCHPATSHHSPLAPRSSNSPLVRAMLTRCRVPCSWVELFHLVRSCVFSSIASKLTVNKAVPRSTRGMTARLPPSFHLRLRLLKARQPVAKAPIQQQHRTHLLPFQTPPPHA
jgi:hypothetical protein